MMANPAIHHTGPVPHPSKTLHYSLWVVQVLLALFFAVVGGAKLLQPIPVLTDAFSWPADVSPGLVRFIGACEIVGAIGLVLPAMMRPTTAPTPRAPGQIDRPVVPASDGTPGLAVVPLAAAGLSLIMIFAAVFHFMRDEEAMAPAVLVVAALAAFVAWGRWMRGWNGEGMTRRPR